MESRDVHHGDNLDTVNPPEIKTLIDHARNLVLKLPIYPCSNFGVH